MSENVGKTARLPQLTSAAAAILSTLGPVTPEPSCIVADDPGEIVRHAQPLDDQARRQIREQQLAQLTRDPVAVAARERRIAMERAPAGRVVSIRRGR